MDKNAIIDICQYFIKDQKIEKASMIRVLEDMFRTIIKKRYEDDDNFDVMVDIDTGDIEIYQYRTIVPNNTEDYDPRTEILLKDAQKIEEDFEVGEEVAESVLDDPKKRDDFTLRNIHLARQTLNQKIKDLEKDFVYSAYKDRIGDMISAEVHQVLYKRDVILTDEEGHELLLPRSEMIYKDLFRRGDTVKGVVKEVNFDNKNLRVVISRISPLFLQRLLENEIPEIRDGIIAIKKIVRKPGERAKVAVESYEERIDPVGACVGIKGSRIHGTVKELQNENIDVINYTTNMHLYIKRALKPAVINDIKINEEEQKVDIFLDQDEVSKAIGRRGLNIRLASFLVGYEINVYRAPAVSNDVEEDVELSEFGDVIEKWILDELRKVGLDTAKSVLALSKEELERRTDLEIETIEDVISIFQKEFE